MFVLQTYVDSVHRVIATLVAVALVAGSVGYAFQAEAVQITQVSDTLSDSAPATASNHTIVFTTPTGIANGETVTIDFSDGPFVVGAVDFEDIDVQDNLTDLSVATDCTGAEEIGAAFAATTLTITFCAGDGASIAANGTTTIEIGTNATFGVAGASQLVNPAVGSYELVIGGTQTDNGATRVAIVDTVTVTASVDTEFDFTITGLATSSQVNGTSTTGSTSPTEIPFGDVDAGVVETLAQRLNVSTNARNGFIVTVETDQQLLSSTGADIDGFRNGLYDDTPVAWEAPANTILVERTYGHWGLTTEDDLNGDEFTGNLYVSASTTPRQIFEQDGPADGVTDDVGSTTVGYQIEITPLQEAGDDYTATLTYIATPTF